MISGAIKTHCNGVYSEKKELGLFSFLSFFFFFFLKAFSCITVACLSSLCLSGLFLMRNRFSFKLGFPYIDILYCASMCYTYFKRLFIFFWLCCLCCFADFYLVTAKLLIAVASLWSTGSKGARDLVVMACGLRIFGSWSTGSVVVAWELSCSVACGIFSD